MEWFYSEFSKKISYFLDSADMGWTKGSRYSQAIGTQRDLVFLPAKAAQISCNLPKLVSYSVCPLINARQLFLTLGLISVVFALCLLIEKKSYDL